MSERVDEELSEWRESQERNVTPSYAIEWERRRVDPQPARVGGSEA